MGILLLGFVCVVLLILYCQVRAEIYSLCEQLREIERGSHIELTVQSRRKPILKLCRVLNQVMEKKDKTHIQYEKAERQLKQNITSLAHDIRTPLTGASGYVQLAQECGDCGRREHYLQAAQVRLAELENMLEEMFLYTKLTGEDFELSKAKLQVFPLLSECLLGMYSEFERLGVSPRVEFESESFCVLADEEALRRVFLNLIQNALLHGNGGICIMQKGDKLIFENAVPDDSRPNPEQLFDRFYKADSARRKGSSGLGLYIVKELMKKLEGDVRAQLEDGVLRIELELKKIT